MQKDSMLDRVRKPLSAMPRANAIEAAAGAVALVASWIYFANTAPMQVLVGTEALDAFVPAHYQASAFPAFAAYSTSLAFDLARGCRLQNATRRIALLGITSALAALRLDGSLPLSGHALLLGAVLANEIARRAYLRSRVTTAFAVPGLLVTAWYKLFVWGDVGWFAASVAVGVVLGVLLAWRDPGP
jgi:hypothetical protein